MLYQKNKCDHLSENLNNLHKHEFLKKKRNLKIIIEITHATGKYLQGLMGQQSAKEASNQQKLYTILLAWLWRVQKSLFWFP